MKIDGRDISEWSVLLESKEGVRCKIKIGELKQALDELTAKIGFSKEKKQ